MSCRRFTVLVLVIPSLLPFASGQTQAPRDLANATLEELMNVQVTSVSKKEEKLSRTAGAIFVISAEDIQNSGATNIPDLLRMVPGMNVAQINANTWAISARGFNAEFSNELLVMVDGRTVYVPTFGGVFWDVLDIPLIDIERIEVIRGPGGAIWGANAVNGAVSYTHLDVYKRQPSYLRGRKWKRALQLGACKRQRCARRRRPSR